MTLPEVTDIYAAHLAADLDELSRAEGFLDAGGLREMLPDGAAADIRTLIRDVRNGLQQQQGVVDWTGFVSAHERAERLRLELFCAMQTALFRAQGFDEALLDAAERLAEHLQRRARVREPVIFGLSADAESLDHTVSLMRLKFPGTSVWHLPVLAHEFGHHAIENLHSASESSRDSRPLHAIVKAEAPFLTAQAGDPRPSWAHEYAADVFGTYSLGTAYPLACMILRIIPRNASVESETHPPWVRRVELMAATLEAMTACTGQGRHAAVAQRVVRPLWARLTGGVLAGPDQTLVLREFAERLVGEMLRHTDGLLYQDADRAIALRDKLQAGEAAPAELEGASVPTILDAAWRWRQDRWTADSKELERVNRIALGWCGAAVATYDPQG